MSVDVVVHSLIVKVVSERRRRFAEPVLCEILDAESHNPIAEHRKATDEKEYTDKNRERYRAADRVEQCHETEDDFDDRKDEKHPPVGHLELACLNCEHKFAYAFIDEPHCKHDGKNCFHDVDVCKEEYAEKRRDDTVCKEHTAPDNACRCEEHYKFDDAHAKHECADYIRENSDRRTDGKCKTHDACRYHEYACYKPQNCR